MNAYYNINKTAYHKLNKNQMQIADNIEMWRLISGYDNYEVSSHGRVRNNRTMHMLKSGTNHGGYLHIGLSKNGKKKTTTKKQWLSVY